MRSFLFVLALLLSRVTGAAEIFLPQPAYPEWWARSGEPWSALFASGPASQPKYEVKPVQSKVYVDARDGVIKLGAQNSPDPILMIAGHKLKTGTVETSRSLKFGTISQLSDAAPIEFEISAKKWKLSRITLSKKGATNEYVEAQTKLVLSSSPSSFEIGIENCRIQMAKSQGPCEEPLILHFVGDLDRDGIPDLFYLPAPARNGPNLSRLWLSSLKQTLNIAGGPDIAFLKPFKAVIMAKGQQPIRSSEVEVAVSGRTTKSQKKTCNLDIWFGIFPSRNGTRIQSSKLWVACPLGLCEESHFFKFSTETEPLFLVRNVPGLADGKITYANIRELPSDSHGDSSFPSFEIEYEQKKLQLKGEKGRFILQNGARTSVLSLKTQDPDDQPRLTWAGDLNRDGEIDFYFEFPQDTSRAHIIYVSPGLYNKPTGPTASFCSGECF